MSLTVALTILGAVVLLALLGHGWWSARRASPRQADAPLAAPQRVEPALGDALPQAPLPAADDAVERRVPAARRQARLDALIDAIKRGHIRVIISEVQLNQKVPQLLARETGAHIAVLTTLPGGVPGTETYLDMLRYNVLQLAHALEQT